MASSAGQPTTVVEFVEQVRQAPYEHDFYLALRQIECLSRAVPRIGETLHISEDPVRLGQEPSMVFAPATFSKVVNANEHRPARLLQWAIGLLGPQGPMPLHLTEYTHERVLNFHDQTFACFLDIFHHRILSMFYRTWAQAQPTVSFDRQDEDRFSDYLASVFGLGFASLEDRDEMPDLAKLYFAGRLSAQTKCPEGLVAILKHIMRLPVVIHEFFAHWMVIPHEYRWHLGTDDARGALGVSATVGERVWDCQSRFRIVMGPMGFRDYVCLLPKGDSLQRLVDVVRNYVGDEISWDVQLVLNRDEVPPLTLGVMGRLGWTTWLGSDRMRRDPDDLVISSITP